MPSTQNPTCDHRGPLQQFQRSSAGLAAGIVPLFGGLHLDCGKPVDPGTQVIGEHKCASTTFDCTQLAGLDCFVESRPTGARDRAGLNHTVSKRNVRIDLATEGRGYTGESARIWADDGELHRSYSSVTGFIPYSISRNGPVGLPLPDFARTSTSLTAFDIAFLDAVCSRNCVGTALVTTVQTNSTKGDGLAAAKLRKFLAAVAFPTLSSNRSASSLTSLDHGSL
jgi:hypothetical protein